MSEIGRPKPRPDPLYPDNHEIEVTFADASLRLVGEKATVVKFAAVLEAIKNSKKCPLSDVDGTNRTSEHNSSFVQLHE